MEVIRQDATESEKRKRIYRYIKENPGSHFRAIKTALNIPNGVLQFHLDKLLRKNKLICKNHGNKKLFFIAGYNERNVGKRRLILHEIKRRYNLLSPKEREIFDILLKEGPVTLEDICTQTGIQHPRHVRPFLKNIERKMGVVIIEHQKTTGIFCYIDFERYS